MLPCIEYPLNIGPGTLRWWRPSGLGRCVHFLVLLWIWQRDSWLNFEVSQGNMATEMEGEEIRFRTDNDMVWEDMITYDLRWDVNSWTFSFKQFVADFDLIVSRLLFLLRWTLSRLNRGPVWSLCAEGFFFRGGQTFSNEILNPEKDVLLMMSWRQATGTGQEDDLRIPQGWEKLCVGLRWP